MEKEPARLLVRVENEPIIEYTTKRQESETAFSGLDREGLAGFNESASLRSSDYENEAYNNISTRFFGNLFPFLGYGTRAEMDEEGKRIGIGSIVLGVFLLAAVATIVALFKNGHVLEGLGAIPISLVALFILFMLLWPWIVNGYNQDH